MELLKPRKQKVMRVCGGATRVGTGTAQHSHVSIGLYIMQTHCHLYVFASKAAGLSDCLLLDAAIEETCLSSSCSCCGSLLARL